MKALTKCLLAAAIPIVLAATLAGGSPAAAQEKKPNVVFIMGDDIGWFNIGATTEASWLAGRPTSISWRPKG
jgi:ABC-type sugar transport system substrate-binding protein